MTHSLRQFVDFLIKAFALGLFASILLSWFDIYALRKIQRTLQAFYGVFLDPIRRYVRPVRFGASSPAGLDLAPLILLFLVWWLVHPFLMWVLN
jgi:uncharacterized protein YggT (Ycf19 family)